MIESSNVYEEKIEENEEKNELIKKISPKKNVFYIFYLLPLSNI